MQNIKINGKYIFCLLVIITVIFSVESLMKFNKWCQEKDKNTNNIAVSDVFDNISLDDTSIQDINAITEYILKKKEQKIKVIVFSKYATLYMTPLKISNNEFDLPFKGNMGNDGENSIIQKISKLEDTEILIVSDPSKMFWQESQKAREYITDNMNNIGTISIYDIYSN